MERTFDQGQQPLVEKNVEKKEELVLKDGSPLWMVFLKDELVADAAKTQEAKAKLAKLMQQDMETVMSCNGKSLQECEVILSSVDSESLAEAA